jgi:CheY-specific phosphatase CheX
MEGLEEELRRVMEEVLLGLLGEPPDRRPSLPPAPNARLVCAIQIRGGWQGEVLVWASRGLASLVADRMFGADRTEPSGERDARDALREVANIVAGNLKPLFGDHNVLGLPEDLPSDTSHTPDGQLAQVKVHHGNGELEVRVFETM